MIRHGKQITSESWKSVPLHLNPEKSASLTSSLQVLRHISRRKNPPLTRNY